ncbi:receptor-like protein 9b [Gossypium hirsutum]|uniref:Receptor-like protein 9b n=1 Tax=Gossypium hirsutum TaxID=3635 RepID=A0ABM2ZDK5_GOSHI|nr:receptor-like protein 9b [Gossypium hirsutum]
MSYNILYGVWIRNERELKLMNLEELNLKGNVFNSSILSSLGSLSNLKSLSLSHIYAMEGLSVTYTVMGLPALKNLEKLRLGCVFGSGWQNLTSLEELILTDSSFTSNIVQDIGTLTALKNLVIDTCVVDDNLDLHVLDLSNNKLSGGIPRHLPMRLVLFNVSSNQLFGDIQSSMENMSHLKTLDLSNNALFGGIPRSMGKMSYLEELVMANNHFEGPIPMEFCKLNYSLIFLDLSANNISGSLPSCFSSLRLTRVYLSRNKLKGPITSFFNSSSLVTLDLSDNHLTGNIPNWIGTLSRLVYLLLNNNHFEGGIPVQLCKLNWLRLIDASSNNLSGTIPPCLMITISNDSSHAYYANHFNYGDIGFFSADVPIKFIMKSISYFYKGRVLTYLSGIDLSCNKLTGEIPHQFQHFRDIIVLNFSQNSLIGPIPPALSDLSQIESLDLSHNNLSENIPSQLLGLYFLSFFSVAYNNLSGTTPERTGQISTFEESSYVGNPLLCGEPLPKNCSTDGSSSSMPKNATEEGFIDMKVFYASFVGSYIVMPLCIAIMLYINPYWRRAWFYHVEAATMSCYYFVLDNILPKRFYEGTI